MILNNSDFKILIVDDVPKNIQVLGSILMKENYNISFANNGTDAISLAAANDLDLILLDVMMPGMDGFETCEKLKNSSETKDIPVIFMTALSETTDKVKGLQAGAVDYITKPYEAEEVLARVKTHLMIRNLQKDLAERIKDLEIRNKFIRRTFGQYLSDEIVHNLLQTDGIQVGGEKRTITILMSDLRGFSSISERLNPEDIVTLLNNYLCAMTDVILKYEGTIDEFIGDAILVLFGAPIWKPDHAERAAACAIEMQNAMEKLNNANRKMNFPELQMGIGINTGEVVVGNIGSIKRAKYGVVGRNVNITSRIQSYTVGNQILISENTFDCIAEIAKTKQSFKVNPKGVKEPVTLYDLVGLNEPYDISLKEKEDILRIPSYEIAFRYTVLDEKSTEPVVLNGNIIQLSAKRAMVRLYTDIPVFSNLKLNIKTKEKVYSTEDLYCKVLSKPKSEEKIYEFYFTSIPDEIKLFFEDCTAMVQF